MDQADLNADAMAAKPLKQVIALTRWVGAGKGRTLIQTGRLTIQTLADPADPEHQPMLAWLGLRKSSDFDPARFDVAQANLRLTAMLRGRLPTS